MLSCQRCSGFRGLFFSCSLSRGVYCAAAECVWGGGGGAPVCVGFINPVHSSKEMLSKRAGVNVNPSVPCVAEKAVWEGDEVAV